MTTTSLGDTVGARKVEWSRWCVPVAVALVIAAATSWPTPVAMPGSSDKVAHLLSYAALAASVAWAARSRRWTQAFGCIVLASLLGAADEWHQQFIPGRRMELRDWFADTVGAVLGSSLVTALARRREPVA